MRDAELLAALVPLAHVALDVRAADKSGVLAALARLAAPGCAMEPGALRDRLAAREALGSTGFGGGVALPHARLAGLRAPVAWVLRLARPVDFAALDAAKVDLVFGLLSPEGDDAMHLANLSAVARRVRSAGLPAALRNARSPAALHAAFVGQGSD
jgi:PTS system nitrogen regulatory IIA component